MPQSWTGCQITSVSLGRNTNLTGPINILSSPYLTHLSAPYTLFQGVLSTAPLSPSLTYLDLSNTPIDFCDATSISNFEAFEGECFLHNTSACLSCIPPYSSCAMDCLGAEYPAEIPSTSPLSPLSPPSLSAPASPTPIGCRGPKPGPEFICIGNIWTARNTEVPILVIPAGVGTIVVTGNVTSSSIIINGLGSDIQIGGCATNLTRITVELSEEEAKRLGKTKSLQTLLTLTGNASSANCSNLNNVEVKSQVKSSCRKVKVDKLVSGNGHSLSGYFTLDSSGCNQVAVILVAVIVPIVILAAGAAVVAYVLWNKHKYRKAKSALG